MWSISSKYRIVVSSPFLWWWDDTMLACWDDVRLVMCTVMEHWAPTDLLMKRQKDQQLTKGNWNRGKQNHRYERTAVYNLEIHTQYSWPVSAFFAEMMCEQTRLEIITTAHRICLPWAFSSCLWISKTPELRTVLLHRISPAIA